MELNKAIEVVRNIDTTDIHCKNCVLEEKDKCITDLFGYSCQRIAIDTVLEELNNRNNRIHKLEKNIEFIINKIVNKAKEYQYHTQITAGTNIETNIGQQILTELLEEIKKEI